MHKTTAYGDDTKDQLRAASQGRAYRFLLADEQVRGVLLHGTRMVYEMRANHELGILETLLLGHGYLAGGLLSTQLKGNDRVRLQVECSGPLQGMIVEANAFGDVRGYLHNVPIPVDRPVDPQDLASFYGAGFLTVTRFPEGARQPFTGKVALSYGSLAKDLAAYFLVSEQIPTALHLSVKFTPDGEVAGAGGLLLQVLPGVTEEVVAGLETLVGELPSLGDLFSPPHQGNRPEELISRHFARLSPRIIGQQRVEFMCHCNRERTASMLAMLPTDDLEEMIANGPFPLEIRCHHCNTHYDFSWTELQEIHALRAPGN
jgi:molecular chaperone Hsp33